MRHISDEYLGMQTALHQNPAYGVASLSFAPLVRDLIVSSGAGSLLDYGAGKCRLRDALVEMGLKDLQYRPYDLVFPEYGLVVPSDIVTCIDVLEHIEPAYVESVIDELWSSTLRFGLFTIHSGAAIKNLPDGRNAHLIQEKSGWWLSKLCLRFDVIELQSVKGGFWVLVTPRK